METDESILAAETPEAAGAEPPAPQGVRLAQAAAITGLGNVGSRALGLLREVVKSDLFGATSHVSAFQVASLLPTQLAELLTGGMVSAALVPVFSEYVAHQREDELWQVYGALLTLAMVLLVALIGALELGADLIARLFVTDASAGMLAETAALMRLVLPAIFFLALSDVLSAMLYTFKRFTLPALVPVVSNAAIVACALALGPRLGIASMAVGFVAAAVLQVALQLPGMRGVRIRPNFHWRHPALGHVVKLYLPVIGGLVISQLSTFVGVALAARTGQSSIAWMGYATFLFQFPLGLVSSAISVAILPTISRQAASEKAGVAGAAQDFRATLAHGLRLVLLLVVPAMAGLFVLGRPIIDVLYRHGTFTDADADITALLLRIFLIGLIFAAVDLPLVTAFYARKDTLTPALVGMAGVCVYLGAAATPLLWRPLQITDLAYALAIQQISHALIMLILIEGRLQREAGHGLRGLGLRTAGLKALLAALGMMPVAYGVLVLAGGALASLPLGRLVSLLLAGAAGAACYVIIVFALEVPEARDGYAWLRSKMTG